MGEVAPDDCADQQATSNCAGLKRFPLRIRTHDPMDSSVLPASSNTAAPSSAYSMLSPDAAIFERRKDSSLQNGDSTTFGPSEEQTRTPQSQRNLEEGVKRDFGKLSLQPMHELPRKHSRAWCNSTSDISPDHIKICKKFRRGRTTSL